MQNQTTGVSLLVTTLPDTESSGALARSLLDAGLIACANCLPGATSWYRWEGALESSAEALMLIKTRTTLVGQVVEAIRKAHPYELPEVLEVPVTGGLEGYLDWVKNETGDASAGGQNA